MINLMDGDCLEELRKINSNSLDSMVTDPPAGISFMGKDWDGDKGGSKQWIAWMSQVMQECLRVLKPGAHAFVWAIPRTSHWTATALEDAGFEIRDVVTHLFGSGFPKSLNIPKQIEKQYACRYLEHAKAVASPLKLFLVGLNSEKTDSVVGAVAIRHEAEKPHQMAIGVAVDLKDPMAISLYESTEHIASSTILSLKTLLEENSDQKNRFTTLTELKTIIDLKIWNLLQSQNTLRSTTALNGTSLKPASEHWILVRKPCCEKTVAANVLKHGCGGINIDASRVGYQSDADKSPRDYKNKTQSTNFHGSEWDASKKEFFTPNTQGRFPANLILSHNPDCMEECTAVCAVAELDRQSGELKPGGQKSCGSKDANTTFGIGIGIERKSVFKDSGGASRFFYCAKASKSEKNAGCETNEHPTVKPQKLMTYLTRMITPPGGRVLDPFMGSGSTGVAAILEGYHFIGIERQPDYLAIAEKRIFNAFVEFKKQTTKDQEKP